MLFWRRKGVRLETRPPLAWKNYSRYCVGGGGAVGVDAVCAALGGVGVVGVAC